MWGGCSARKTEYRWMQAARHLLCQSERLMREFVEWSAVARKHSRSLVVSQRCLLVVGSGREWAGKVVGSGREWAASKHLWLTAKALECLRATPDHSRPLASLTAKALLTVPTTPDHSRPQSRPTPDHFRPLPDHFRPLPTTSDHFRPLPTTYFRPSFDHSRPRGHHLAKGLECLQEPLPTTPKTPDHSGKVLG